MVIAVFMPGMVPFRSFGVASVEFWWFCSQGFLVHINPAVSASGVVGVMWTVVVLWLDR